MYPCRVLCVSFSFDFPHRESHIQRILSPTCAELQFLVSAQVWNNVGLLNRWYLTFYRFQSDFIGSDRRTDTLCEDWICIIFAAECDATNNQPGVRFRVVVFSATFNNILVISWWSVLLVEVTGVFGENHWPVASHWQTLSNNVASSRTPLSGIQTLNVSGDRQIA